MTCKSAGSKNRAMFDIDKKGNRNYKIGIYVRESRDENEENYETIETQKGLLLDFVEKNRLGEVARIYMDDNVSGSGFNRPGIELLKEDVSECRINLLLLKDLSRLGRNNAKTLLFLDFLEEYGIRVITYDGRYDSIKDNDTVGIETWFNERYIRDISKKIRANLRFKISKGEYIGHAPYGYVKSEEHKNRLCVEEAAAPVVRDIYRLYREGFGYLQIAKTLNSRGCPPPSERQGSSGSGLWNAVAVKRILGSRVYIGDTVQGVSEKVSFKSKKTRRLPRELWVLTENTHEAIISREEYEEVRKIREARNPGHGAHKGTLHLLKGMLFCGCCGSAMFARKRKNKPIGYICGNYARSGRTSCTSHYIDESTVSEILSFELSGLFQDRDLMEKVEEKIGKEPGNGHNAEKEAERLGQLILTKQRQQDMLYMDKLEGKISEQLFIRTNTNLENRITQFKNELEKLGKQSIDTYDIKKLIQMVLEDLKQKGITRDIVKLMVEKIVVFDGTDDVDGFLRGNVQAEEAKIRGVVLVEFKF